MSLLVAPPKVPSLPLVGNRAWFLPSPVQASSVSSGLAGGQNRRLYVCRFGTKLICSCVYHPECELPVRTLVHFPGLIFLCCRSSLYILNVTPLLYMWGSLAPRMSQCLPSVTVFGLHQQLKLSLERPVRGMQNLVGELEPKYK